MNRIRLFGFAITFFAFSVTAALADLVVFDSSFTQAEGYADGNVNFNPANPKVAGAGVFSVTDSAGLGFLSNSSGTSFGRTLFGLDGTDSFDENFLANLPVGDSIQVEALGVTFTNITLGSNVGVFGLSNIDSGNVLGSTSLAIGTQLVSDGTNILVDPNTNFSANVAGGIDTGVDAGDTFDLALTITATATGVYDVTTAVNGSGISTTTGVGATLDKSSTDLSGHIQDFGGAGPFTIDRLRIATIAAIPEPSAAIFMTLATVAGTGLIFRKRHI